MKNSQRTGYKDLKISTKLGLGFGIFVLLAFLSAGMSYYGSSVATNKINLTNNVRMPVTLTASQAQTDLLRMISDIRGYLALGDRDYWDNYLQSDRAFQDDLAALEQLASDFDPVNMDRFTQLKRAYQLWSTLPERLYALRNDQLDREPAYRILATDGVRTAGQVLIMMNNLIEAPQAATEQSVSQLQEMASFEASFSAMLSALRGYTTTRNRIFRQEYEVNLAANEISWSQILSKKSNFSTDQQKVIDQVQVNRQSFLQLPDQIFPILEGDHWREDLYLFRTEAVPVTDQMSSLLSKMTSDQQTLLTSELDQGRRSLVSANQEILAGGIAAVLIAILLGFISRSNIAAPILRLTGIAEQIQQGDLAAQAKVESRDEIGILARTFNSMTSRLRETLTQVRKEKTRADSLLNFVIPLGVQLSSEKDFDLLVERTLVDAMTFCHADCGLLYLRTKDETLQPVIIRNDKQNIALGGRNGSPVIRDPLPLIDRQEFQQQYLPAHVAMTGQTINLDLRENSQATEYDLQLEANETGSAYPASILAIPLKNNSGLILGVLELLDAKEADSSQYVPFDLNLQQMMESYSSLAVAALEAYIREQSLRQEIQQLRIEIDEVKRQQQVNEIVETDFFQDLQERARNMRDRRRQLLSPE